jgi:hypothetical protein
MNKLLLIFALFLTACAQKDYSNGKYSCNGEIYTNIVYVNGNSQNFTHEKQIIAMRIENNKVYFSGSTLLLGDAIQICKVGTIEFAKKDEMYFDTNGCTMNVAQEKNRKFGTYNFITKVMHLTNELENELGTNSGKFVCEKVN